MLREGWRGAGEGVMTPPLWRALAHRFGARWGGRQICSSATSTAMMLSPRSEESRLAARRRRSTPAPTKSAPTTAPPRAMPATAPRRHPTDLTAAEMPRSAYDARTLLSAHGFLRRLNSLRCFFDGLIERCSAGANAIWHAANRAPLAAGFRLSRRTSSTFKAPRTPVETSQCLRIQSSSLITTKGSSARRVFLYLTTFFQPGLASRLDSPLYPDEGKRIRVAPA